MVFSFDLSGPGNSAPSLVQWQQQYFGSSSAPGAAPEADPDGDGLTNLQEYLRGSNPNDYYNGRIPLIRIVKGDGQKSRPGLILPEPLVVEVTNGSGMVVKNAPVTFQVTSVGGGVAATSNSQAFTTSLAIRTDALGRAQVWFEQPNVKVSTSKITAQAGVPEAVAAFYVSTHSLIGYWPLNDNTGANFPDLSGFGREGGVNGAEWQLSEDGATLRFDGNSGFAWIKDSAGFSLGGEATISAWVKITDPNLDRYMRILSKKHTYPGGNGFEFEYNPALDRLTWCGNGSEQLIACEVALEPGWHHLAVVLAEVTPGSELKGTFYVDGKELGNYQTPLAGVPFPGGAPQRIGVYSGYPLGSNVKPSGKLARFGPNLYNLTLGRHAVGDAGATNFLKGSLTEIQIHDRALSALEIEAIEKDRPDQLVTAGFKLRVGIMDPALDDDAWTLLLNDEEVVTNSGNVFLPATTLVNLPYGEQVTFTLARNEVGQINGSSEEYRFFFSNRDASPGIAWSPVASNSPLEDSLYTNPGPSDPSGRVWRFNIPPAPTSTLDSDDDGLSDIQEVLIGTYPNIPDSDDDGLSDGEETAGPCLGTGTNPREKFSLNPNFPDSAFFLKVLVGIRDPQLLGKAWAVYCNEKFVVSNAADPTRPAYRAVFVPRGRVASFKLQRVEVGQARDFDEYRVSFTDPVDPTLPVAWLPFADNPPLSESFPFTSFMNCIPPDISGNVWLFWVPSVRDAAIGPDSDNDKIDDAWERAHSLDPSDPSDAGLDGDNDGLTNLVEYLLGLEISSNDSDGDGMPDGWERANELDPKNPNDDVLDPDNDGFSNVAEYRASTDPKNPLSFVVLPPVSPSPGPGPDPAPPGPPPLPPAPYQILVKVESIAFPKYGVGTYQQTNPPRRYLMETLTSSFNGGCPESPVSGAPNGSRVTTFDPFTGNATVTTKGAFGGAGGSPLTPLYRVGFSNVDGYDDPPNRREDCDATIKTDGRLQNENTTTMMVANAMTKLGRQSPSPEFVPGTPYAYRNVHENELQFDYQRVAFKFEWPEGTAEEQKHPVSLVLIFRPEENPEEPEAIRAVTWDGRSNKEFSIDPEKERPGIDGVYSLLPVEFEIYKPDTASEAQWQDEEQKMPWEELFVFDDPEKNDFKFKVKFYSEISSSLLEQIDVEVGIHSPGWPEPKKWVRFNLGDIGRLSADKKEAFCTIPYGDVLNKIRPQIPAVSEREFSSLDWIADVAISSYDDANNFDRFMDAKGGSVKMVSARGKGNDSHRSISDPPGETILPWTARANKEYLIGGGAAYIEVRIPSASNESSLSESGGARALCREQVDRLYLSVHGWHSASPPYPSGSIELYDIENGNHEFVTPEEVKWGKDLEVVVIAGCSVLDINDYNNNYAGSDHNDSPGKRWEQTGPEYLLGYNTGGPRDRGVGDGIAAAWAATVDIEGKIDAWRYANEHKRSWNACAVHAGEGYYYFATVRPFGLFTLVAKWTHVPKSEW